MVFSLCVCSLVMNRSLLHTPSPCLVDSLSHPSPLLSFTSSSPFFVVTLRVFQCPCVCLCVGAALCVFVCVRVSVSHTSCPHRRSRHPVQHLVHCMHDTHFQHKSSHVSSPTTRHAHYRRFSLGHVMLVFPSFSFTPQESAEVLGAKNFAPRVCSCLPFCSPISAPFQAADFALEPMRHRQLDGGDGGGCHHRAGPLFLHLS